MRPPGIYINLRAVLASLLISLLFVQVSLADFKDAYKDGIRAAQDQNWALVESKMREALSAQPSPQAKVRLYGMRFEPYVPHHYLALAAAARNNCPAALAALSNSAHQAALSDARDAAELLAAEQQIKRRCQNSTPTAPPSTPVLPDTSKPPVISTPAPKPPIAGQTTPNGATTTPAASAVPALSTADIARARSAVQALKRELSAARSTFAKPELAAEAAKRANELSTLDADAARLSLDLDRAIANLDSALLGRTNSAASSAATRATALKQAAFSALAIAAPVTRPAAPAPLLEIAKSFFAGDFKAAAQSNVESLQGKALAHALLLRAAARYSLYVAQGESKSEQLNAVKADLARAKSVDASVRPSSKYFSPRLIQLY